jgi:simple sugar transport system permease protein
LILTGASVLLAFRCGLFNIGAEGQLLIGSMAAASVGILFPSLPSILAIPFSILAAFLGGAFWGLIPGVLKAYRGSHEVINTIMMNFIASAFTSFLTLYVFKNPDTQNPETKLIGEGFRLQSWSIFEQAPIGTSLIWVLGVVAGVWLLFRFTVLGFQLRATGANPTAARMSGISSRKMIILAMTLAGGIAGLVAIPEVLGNSFRFKMGFSADYGFIGIAVALLAKKNPFALIPAALLFAVLHKGSTALDLETEKVTKDFAYILQAVIILWVGADGFWSFFLKTFGDKQRG